MIPQPGSYVWLLPFNSGGEVVPAEAAKVLSIQPAKRLAIVKVQEELIDGLDDDD